MTKTEIIAAMTVAYGVANVDGLKEDEAAMLIKELKSYKFANDPEQYQEASSLRLMRLLVKRLTR